MMDKQLLKRLVKPHLGETDAIVYYEIIAYNKDNELLPSKFFIEEEHARNYQLDQMSKGYIVWKYCRVAYMVEQVENIDFMDA